MRNETFAITSEDAGRRLDVWLTGTLGEFSRSFVERLIEQGHVTVGGKTVKAGYKLKEAIQCRSPYCAGALEVTAEDPLDIIHEDEDIIVITSPGHGGASSSRQLQRHARKCAPEALRRFTLGYKRVIRPGIVHRIDKDTSGVLVTAKTTMPMRSFQKSSGNTISTGSTLPLRKGSYLPIAGR